MKISIDNGSKLQINISGRVTTGELEGIFVDKINALLSNVLARKKMLILSIREVKWFDADALPMLLMIGRILRDYYNESIELLLPESDNIRQFLDVSHFFYHASVEDGGKSIFKFDEDEAYRYDTYGREYNPQNIVECFPGYYDYYELSEDDREDKKYQIQDHYRLFLMNQLFGHVIDCNIGKTTREYDLCMDALSEIICNAVLYSLSTTYVGVQTLNKDSYSICVCDSGIGFTGSLEKKGLSPDASKRFLEDENLAQNEYLEDFFSLFSALKIAEETQRTNLWKLIQVVCSNKGVMFIHTNRVEVRFDESITTEDVYTCMNDIIKHYSSDSFKSSMRLFRTRLKGVHVRILFERN